MAMSFATHFKIFNEFAEKSENNLLFICKELDCIT